MGLAALGGLGLLLRGPLLLALPLDIDTALSAAPVGGILMLVGFGGAILTWRLEERERRAAESRAAPVGPPGGDGERAASRAHWWDAGVRLSPAVTRAMSRAAGELAPGERLTTGRVLAALVQADARVGWEGIWLRTGGFRRTALASAPDPPDPPPDVEAPSTWRGVPLSGRLTASLTVAGRVGERYGLPAGSTGVIVLGLLAYRGSGATEALLGGGGFTHGTLLRQVQTDILGTTLSGLGAVIPAADS